MFRRGGFKRQELIQSVSEEYRAAAVDSMRKLRVLFYNKACKSILAIIKIEIMDLRLRKICLC